MKPRVYVVGPQGCGKTRLASLLSSFVRSEGCPPELRGVTIVEVQTVAANGVLTGVTLEDLVAKGNPP